MEAAWILRTKPLPQITCHWQTEHMKIAPQTSTPSSSKLSFPLHSKLPNPQGDFPVFSLSIGKAGQEPTGAKWDSLSYTLLYIARSYGKQNKTNKNEPGPPLKATSRILFSVCILCSVPRRCRGTKCGSCHRGHRTETKEPCPESLTEMMITSTKMSEQQLCAVGGMALLQGLHRIGTENRAHS